jgi:LysR family transcriptional activator of nhaA
MECYEGKLNDLLVDLAMHRLDLVLSDSPAPGTLDVNVYSHKLGECGLSILATPALAKKFRKGFPNSITNAPILLPTKLTAVRRSLDRWMEDRKVFPEIVAEFEDSALLKVFGQAGQGVFPVPTAIEDLVKKQYGAWLVGRIPEVLDTFYVISVEKRVQHHAAIRIMRQARNKLFE